MLEKKSKDLKQMELISIEELVPGHHLLRKIDSAVDFTRIYDFVENLYCEKRQTQYSPSNPLQNGSHSTSLWYTVVKENSGRSQNECCIPTVLRLSP